MSRLMLALTLVSARRMARGRAANADLEGAVRGAYVDKHQVHHGSVQVDGEAVEFLEAGPKDAAKTVLFCHGAAFSMTTWQHVGVLDALAERGMRAIALNLPGYGASSKAIGGWQGKAGFLRRVVEAMDLPSTLMIVAASMGGSYALPFVQDPGPYKIAGYVAAAAVRSRHNARPPSIPILGIYGSEDQPRLDSDRRACFADPPSPYGCYGNRSQLIVLANAPHPCYLRDAAAARQFTNLVVAFAGGAMSRDMGSTPLHAYSAHVAAATAEPTLSVRAAW